MRSLDVVTALGLLQGMESVAMQEVGLASLSVQIGAGSLFGGGGEGRNEGGEVIQRLIRGETEERRRRPEGGMFAGVDLAALAKKQRRMRMAKDGLLRAARGEGRGKR